MHKANNPNSIVNLEKNVRSIFSIKNDRDKKVLRILGVKFSISRFKFQKIKSFQNEKPTIAFQVFKMDKGGLEEVVLQLASSPEIREKYNTVIIAVHDNRGYLAKKAVKIGIPVYSFFHNTKFIPDLVKKLNIRTVHFHYELAGVEEWKKLGLKTIYTIHNNYIWLNKLDTELRNEQYKNIDKFVSVSSQVKEFFVEKFGKNDAEVCVIPNGIEYVDSKDVIPFKKDETGFKKGDFVMLCVASFSLYKYHFAQIKALSLLKQKYDNIKLLLIGNVAEKDYYENLLEYIRENGVEQDVKIVDYVPKNEVYRYLKMSDCIINTSVTEGFSIALLEALLFNKPIVLADIAGARDMIKENDIGIIIPHAVSNLQALNINKVREDVKNKRYLLDNVEKIVEAVSEIYENQDKWRQKTQNAHLKVKNIFNFSNLYNKYLKEYDELVGVNNGRNQRADIGCNSGL